MDVVGCSTDGDGRSAQLADDPANVVLSPLTGLSLSDALEPTAYAVGYSSYAPAGACLHRTTETHG